MQEKDNKNKKLINKAEVKTVSRQDLPTLQLIFCLRWQVKHQKDVISVVLFNLYHFSWLSPDLTGWAVFKFQESDLWPVW